MALFWNLRYLDPSTGGMLLQYSAAILLSLIYIAVTRFKKIKKKLKQARN